MKPKNSSSDDCNYDVDDDDKKVEFNVKEEVDIRRSKEVRKRKRAEEGD